MDKPTSMTSRQAGWRVAQFFRQKKFGHVGTLDPMATGLIVIALGEATKMIPFLPNIYKEYEFALKWGIETDTGDITGNIINQEEGPPRFINIDNLKKLTGEIYQIPPRYSAIHINGRRAYEFARAGQAIDMQPRKVHIFDLEHCGVTNNIFRVKCGPGTYVRSIAQDIGRLAGHINTVAMIRRIATNGFDIKDAITLELLENNRYNADVLAKYLLTPDFGLDDIPVAKLDMGNAELFQNGGAIRTKDETIGLRRVYSKDKFIGMGMNESYLLSPKRIIKN